MVTDTELLHAIESFIVLPHCGISDHECLSVFLNTKGFYAQDVPQIRIIKGKPFAGKAKNVFIKIKISAW